MPIVVKSTWRLSTFRWVFFRVSLGRGTSGESICTPEVRVGSGRFSWIRVQLVLSQC